jgi:hypothetical protein
MEVITTRSKGKIAKGSSNFFTHLSEIKEWVAPESNNASKGTFLRKQVP